MNLFKIHYILPSQLCGVVFISLPGHAQISKGRENVKIYNRSQQIYICFCISKADSVSYVSDAVKSVIFRILKLET